MTLPLALTDDVGTRYESRTRSAGGTGTEWRGEWRFEPGVPREARRLVVALGELHARELLLPARD